MICAVKGSPASTGYLTTSDVMLFVDADGGDADDDNGVDRLVVEQR